MRNLVSIGLLFSGICFLLSMVIAVSPTLPSGETAFQWLWFDRAALAAAASIVVGLLLCRKGMGLELDFSTVVSWALIGWAAVQAVIGLRQVFGFEASGHALYALTGSFFNPGPYAGYLAMALPVCLYEYLCIERERAWRRYVAGGVGLLLLCVLPATMSRSAWLAAGVSCLWVYGCLAGWGKRLQKVWEKKSWRLLAAAVGICLLVCLAGMLLFSLKPDSARGRLFMWRMSARAVAEKPWSGYGLGNFSAAYGEAQAGYFAAGGYTEWEERVAGSPEYAFNEYVQSAVEMGIPLTLGLVALLVGCGYVGWWKHRYGVCGALLSLGVFAFSSYPLQLPVFLVTGVCLLAACLLGKSRKVWWIFALCVAAAGGGRLSGDRAVVEACREWANARTLYHAGAYGVAEEEYKQLYPLLRGRASFLFEYGHGLHKQGKYEASNRVLEEAAKHSCDPMIWNIRGKNHQALGNGKEAEQCFLHAMHLLPGRIYPYYLLAKLYASAGYRHPEKLEEMKHLVRCKEPKVPSMAIREMREEVERLE